MVFALLKGRDVLVIRTEREIFMKKFDKEYATQYTPEKDYLQRNGIFPAFIKVIDEVITYKYKKTSELFRLLALFYKQYD